MSAKKIETFDIYRGDDEDLKSMRDETSRLERQADQELKDQLHEQINLSWNAYVKDVGKASWVEDEGGATRHEKTGTYQ